ncbi:radical SAM family heme chaperone HemW [Alginatibacterium sediminis]|uniref:Heme chaperone HemW n=1 Tax=Alginatibacterium sediminis TaxID=2164068 RepID=A0A420E8D8_9ALTE|nr:radical SAM family heme chaperone HemW [Alginatibacterium sediminis]RKF15671.1 radical SAM family heme chaperone HemW [Alginatibacterium sediminis]
MTSLPKLSLYVHIPWCVQKCPYCDFNSHGLKHKEFQQSEYVDALLEDLDFDIKRFNINRPLHSIFIGGGTPSLFDGQHIARLLQGIRQRIPLESDCEISLEANPGTAEAQRFQAYFEAGVNRLSIGVQSFNAQHLQKLGRIHDPIQASAAVKMAKDVGFKRLNIDIMHGLMQQDTSQALDDLRQAIALDPSHISWYQLTIEANTAFASKPPTLPDDDMLWDIFEQGRAMLSQAGYQQYEVSAFAKVDEQSRHNLNYWRFGDYLGIGCGAHGKISDVDLSVQRSEKIKHPKGYLAAGQDKTRQLKPVEQNELVFEFFLNRLRLFESIPFTDFENFCSLDRSHAQQLLHNSIDQGLIELTSDAWLLTPRGQLFVNEILQVFVDQ